MKIHLKKWIKGALAVSLLMGVSQVQAELMLAEQKLIDGVKNNTNSGGDSVAIDGEWAFVGDVDECQVFVYKYDYITNLWGDGGYNGTATPDPVTAGKPYIEIRPTGSCATGGYGGLGKTVSTSNGVVVVGAPDSKDGGSVRHGKIFLYYFDPVAAIAAGADGNLIDNRGGWVRYTAVGLPEYRDNVDTSIIINDIQDGAEFGSVVSVVRTPGTDKAIISIGAPGYDDTNPVVGENAGSNEGKIYVYQWSTTDNNATLINGQAGEYPQDHVGTAITSNGTELIASAPYWDNNGTGGFPLGGGAVYLFGYDVDTFLFDFEHRIQSGGYFTPGPNYPVDGSGTTLPLIGTELQVNQHLGWTLSYQDSIIALGGINTYLYDHVHGPGGYFDYVTKKVDTDHADVSQSGDVINIAVRGDQNLTTPRDGSFNVYFLKHAITDPLPAPNVTYSKAESDYGRDISLDVPRLMVNGNENNTSGQGTGIAYAYHPTCGLGGALKSMEWQMIGLQCDITTGPNVTDPPASIEEIFGASLGEYGTDWIISRQKDFNYVGHQADFVQMAAGESMKIGVGYWIISALDKTFQVNNVGKSGNPIYGHIPPKQTDLVAGREHEIGAVTKLNVYDMMGGASAFGRGDVGGTGHSDFRVMFSNPLKTPTDWSEAIIGIDGVNFNTIKSTLIDKYFEGQVTAWAYNPSDNWYTAVSTVPGMEHMIMPGQGYRILFSNDFWLDILSASATAAEFNLAEAK